MRVALSAETGLIKCQLTAESEDEVMLLQRTMYQAGMHHTEYAGDEDAPSFPVNYEMTFVLGLRPDG